MRLFHLSLVLAVAALTSSATIVRAGETPAGALASRRIGSWSSRNPTSKGSAPRSRRA